MLQPAVNVSVSPAVTPASPETEAAIPGDFAALLALDPAGGALPVADESATLPVPVESVIRQDGKLAGKVLPVPLPVATDEAEAGLETTSAAEDDPTPEQAVEKPAITPQIVLAGVPALPVMPALPEAPAAPARDAQAPSSPAASAQTPVAALVSEEAPAPALPRVVRQAPDVSAVRFVQPDSGEEGATTGPETAKLVEARASARPAADSQPRQGAEAAAASGKTGRAMEPMPAAPPALVSGDAQSAMLVRDLPLQAAPAQSAPAPQAAIRPAPHDFATLVDRLVEARDAAGAHPVGAAIAHAEFGRVSLRFHQDGGALSVAMSSADPGFAPAVAAAQTATSQQQDNTAGQQRPEQQAQQGTANPQAQSQGSAQHASARGGDRAGSRAFDPAGDGQPQAPADDGAPDTRRRGIYA